MNRALLEGRDITVQFGQGSNAFEAVKSASMYINSGEIVGIVGESGSSKTTLARVLVGLQPIRVGAVSLEETLVLSSNSKKEIPKNERWKIQMVFQDPYSSLNPRIQAWKTVAEVFQVWKKLSPKQGKKAAFDLLQSIGITASQAKRYPRSLSGGQRQRVSIARALAPGPKVLIADEPTSSIDQSAQAQLINLLNRLQSERDLAILFISHDLALVRYITSRVYVMKQGCIVEEGNTKTVLHRPKHPYTKLLLESLPGKVHQQSSS